MGWYVSLQQEDVLSPLLCSFVLEYFIRKIEANWEGLKLNVTHQFLVSANDVNMLGKKHTHHKEKHRSLNSH